MNKLYLTIVLSSLCFIGIHAQKMNVESFIVKTSDITARTQPRQDINGNDCALIKVQLAASGAEFVGNVVGNVSYNKSEYLVYMSKGSKRLSVKLEGYLPLEASFEDYGIKALEGKTTYVMTISGATVARQIEAPKIKTGWIILESEPSGASVYINDEFVGNTPLNNYKQSYGTYQYRLESPNYHPATGTIELNAGRFEQRIALKPAFGSISVKSNVAGAKILLDGKPTGKNSPATLTEIPSGSHTITLQSDKYAPQQQNVVVEDGQATDVSMSLDARFARITINSIDGAEIYSNGKLLGRGHYSEDMMEGYYDLEVRLNHHKSVTKQIQVIAGQSQDITLNPIPKYGSLDVTSTPHDAEVTIDGKPYGKTPLTVNQLLEGEHHVALSLEGYAKETRDIKLDEKESSTINVILSKERTTVKSNVIAQAESVPKIQNVKTFTFKDIEIRMIRVEGGAFTMGATPEQSNDANSNERPTHRVTLSTYYIGEIEVTQELWQAVMGSNPSRFIGLKRPVERVSWDDCQAFIRRLNILTDNRFRLPTEAEWEFAARGGNNSRGNRYAGSNTISEVAWYDDNSNSETHNVAQKNHNELGLYDMSGNVLEWCQDKYDDRYRGGSETNPIGPIHGMYNVLRGGCWSFGAERCRVSYRHSATNNYRNNLIGFRLAL